MVRARSVHTQTGLRFFLSYFFFSDLCVSHLDVPYDYGFMHDEREALLSMVHEYFTS